MFQVDGIDGEFHSAPFDPQGLPETSGIYLIFKGDECLYVGQSQNLRRRWETHHRLTELKRHSAELTLAWMETPRPTLVTLERLLIDQLQPRLNGTPVTDHAPRKLVIIEDRLWRRFTAVLALEGKRPSIVMESLIKAYIDANEAAAQERARQPRKDPSHGEV